MKTYTFTKASSPNNQEVYTITEELLTQQHKDILLGELIHNFENVPLEIQLQFLAEIRSRGNIDWNTEMW